MTATLKKIIAISFFALNILTAYQLHAMDNNRYTINSAVQVEQIAKELGRLEYLYKQAGKFCHQWIMQPSNHSHLLHQLKETLEANNFSSIEALANHIKQTFCPQLFGKATPELSKSMQILQQRFYKNIGMEAVQIAIVQNYAKQAQWQTAQQQTKAPTHLAHKFAAQQALRRVIEITGQPEQLATESSQQITAEPANFATHSVTFWPIFKAFDIAEKTFGSNQWNSINDMQRQYLQYYHQYKASLEMFSEQEMQAIASQNHEVINTFLRANGFDIQLDQFSPLDIGFAAVMKYAVEWQTKGTSRTIKSRYTQQVYPAFAMKNYRLYHSPSHNYEIFALSTKTNDIAYITMVDQPLDHFALLKTINSIKEILNYQQLWECPNLIIPKVSLNQQVDVSWLLGMKMPHGIISQALQQNKFSMDELGAKAESAFAMGVMRGGEPTPYLINGPFIIWFERADCPFPVFAAYVTEDDWKDPKAIQ